MSGRAFLLLAAVACSSPAKPTAIAPAPAKPAIDVTALLVDAIEKGDHDLARTALCAAYEAGGLGCAETLSGELLAPTDVMSRIDTELHLVRMQPMPPKGGGYAYWDNWSKVLSGGAWQPRSLFADDDEARRIANVMLVTVLAHELGHHVATDRFCHPFGAAAELRADELSTPLVREVMTGPLAPLHARMREVADAMIAAVPAEQRVEVPAGVDVKAWVAAHELPDVPASYASLHLSRQRRVLADPTPFATAARTYCLDSYERRLAGRALVPTTVSTLSSYVSKDYATYDIDPSGGVWSLPVFLDDGASLVLRTGDRAIERPAPPELRVVRGIAVMSADRFAVHDGVGLFLYEQSAWRQLETSGIVSEIAFAHDGTLYVGTVLDKIERIGPHGAEPRWQLTWEGDRSYWGDGPRDRAFGDLRAISVDGDRLVFFDLVNQAARRIDARGNVSTLAGSRAGHHDGAGDQARFFWVTATRVMPDGSILAVEGSSKHVRLRKIVPR